MVIGMVLEGMWICFRLMKLKLCNVMLLMISILE